MYILYTKLAHAINLFKTLLCHFFNSLYYII
jgi:hypothetical protein